MTPVIASDVDELVGTFVHPGEHLHLAATQARPNALTYALCRVFGRQGNFSISTTAVHSSAHALALSGCARRVIAGFVGDTFPSPRPNPLYERLAEGEPFEFEAWSLLSYVQRLLAGAMGVPYAVTGSLAGTDLAEGKGDQLWQVDDPIRPGRQVTLAQALRPDLTLVHGACADEAGNIVMFPPLGEGPWAAYAARRGVIASVERIVSSEELRELSDRVVIPGQRVLGLCEAPLGAHPQSLRAIGVPGVASYLDDYAFLEHIVQQCQDDSRGRDWYQEWVLDVGSHAGYVSKLRDRRPTVPQRRPVESSATRQERLIVLAARAVVEQVRSGGYDTLLAGIGSSHMAAWLAAELLQREGNEVKVAAELGAYGFSPQDGDVFLFSLRHAADSEALSGIVEILGGMVSANPRALGVLAAAEIDETGTINTSRTADGRWLTGSGGANDIASSADCVVIATASPRRFVQEVSYRTSPGNRVREVVSQFGRFQRQGEASPFRLTSWLPEDAQVVPDDPAAIDEAARAEIRERTSWRAAAADVLVEKPVTDEELSLLRTFDPDGRYR
ncbi:CoA-transferase [Streptomyces sp. NPDC001793]|uniref:CoA-transferase n=1 Tax=Streptomyces sp. NPDC001793 TaxID=3154657 RepID=UPI00331D64F4